MKDANTNDYVRICLKGLGSIKKQELFDWKTHCPGGEGDLIKEEAVGKIDDVTLLPELIGLLKSTQNRSVHHWVVFILYRLFRNTRSSEVANSIIEHIKEQTDAWKINSLVGAIADNALVGNFADSTCPIERLGELVCLLNDSRRDVRHNTLRAFADSSSTIPEDPLIYVLETSKDQWELLYATRALRKVGTIKSLEVLKRLLYHKKQDIKLTSLAAIANILKEEGSDFYIQFLEDSKYREKWAIICWIHEYCGDEAVPVVVKRIKTILKTKRSNRSIFIRQEDRRLKSELILAIEYIDRHKTVRREVFDAYDYIIKRWEYVLEEERAFLTESIDAFYPFKKDES